VVFHQLGHACSVRAGKVHFRTPLESLEDNDKALGFLGSRNVNRPWRLVSLGMAPRSAFNYCCALRVI